MDILTTLLWVKDNWKKVVKGICVASVAFLLLWGINTHQNNIKLSQELEMAQNNIEAYQGLLDSSQQANNVLRLDLKELENQNDITLHKLDSIRQKLKLKPKSVLTAATQSQVLNVNDSKGVGGDLVTILKDTVNIGLDVQNEQYLYIYTTREYKNKKNFFKRLFTWDWKKVDKCKWENYNTNDLFKSSNIRVVVSTKK